MAHARKHHSVEQCYAAQAVDHNVGVGCYICLYDIHNVVFRLFNVYSVYYLSPDKHSRTLGKQCNQEAGQEPFCIHHDCQIIAVEVKHLRNYIEHNVVADDLWEMFFSDSVDGFQAVSDKNNFLLVLLDHAQHGFSNVITKSVWHLDGNAAGRGMIHQLKHAEDIANELHDAQVGAVESNALGQCAMQVI
jgi:hypothetical protein